MSASSSRLLHIDALKALAAQLIVLHHLSVYGPLADALHELYPRLMALFFHEGRKAVQVFLVVGGYLSARALSARGGLLQGHPGELLWRRYLRLALPFMAAIGLCLGCAWLVAPWLPEFLPQQLGPASLLSHALLLHGVLGHESLTVGAWYVAMDLQLYALLLGLLWLARSSSFVSRATRMQLGPALVLLVCAASMFVFNRVGDLDNWALYFFGAYGLGALVHWLSLSAWPRLGLAMLLGLALLALHFAFRDRLLLASVTAGLLALWRWRDPGQGQGWRQRLANAVAHQGRHSYALFLVHFPVLMLLNAWFDQQEELSEAWTVLLALSILALANLSALPFYRWIEAPSARLRAGWAWLQPMRSLTR